MTTPICCDIITISYIIYVNNIYISFGGLIMFCNKCGKELSDNATFCSGCGNQVGAAPAAAPAAAAPASLPPILSRFISQVTNFFTKKDPVGVVANSAKDNSFSGIILAIFGMIMFALSAMVNINQGLISLAKTAAGDFWNKKFEKLIAKTFPSGTSFGMFLLLAAIVFVVASAMVYVATTKVAKKQIGFGGAMNVVAYASIPVIAVSILNMVLGLIWYALPVFFIVLALCLTLCIIGASVDKITESEKPLTVKALVFGVTAFAALIFLWIALKAVNDAKDEAGAIISYISNFFYDK